jgi:UDPglucose 6-dehydrogenase
LLEKARPHIRFTSDVAELSRCQVIYFSQDVPTDRNNQSDLSSFPRRLDEVSRVANEGATLVILSQVPPGFTRKMAGGRDLTFCYQVETLIFGRAVERALYPERFIVGCDNPNAPLPEAFATFLKSFECPILPMRYESAELAKISINFCLVASVSVANTLAEVCEAIGADWSEIVPALKLDKRIGQHAYLSPGLGIAGGNLERDLLTVHNLAAEHGTDARLIDAYLTGSRHCRDWVLRTIHRELPSLVPRLCLGTHCSQGSALRQSEPAGYSVAREAEPPRQCVPRQSLGTIALWGLAYKQDTKSTKNSPALALLDSLGSSVSIRAYDPQAQLDNGQYSHVFTAGSALEACHGADVLAIMTPWAEFTAVDLDEVAARMRGRLIVDPYALWAKRDCEAKGFTYCRLGTPSRNRRNVA